MSVTLKAEIKLQMEFRGFLEGGWKIRVAGSPDDFCLRSPGWATKAATKNRLTQAKTFILTQHQLTSFPDTFKFDVSRFRKL
jgi:hypothetical protein